MESDDHDVTLLLGQLQQGESGAADRLLGLIYDELRRLARTKMARERAGHTLQPTALANEAFVKLLGHQRVEWSSRAHFLAVAALAMRRILINHAAAKVADKRGGGAPIAELQEDGVGREVRASELVSLDEALDTLAEKNERQARVVAYKFFGGMSYEEIAEVVGISVPTVRRDWRFARAWLHTQLTADR